MKRILVVMLLLPVTALAQTPAPTAPPGPPPGVTMPASTGAPHICSHENYPPDAVRGGEEGTARIEFHITESGVVANPVIAKSSGYADLDAAALACVARFRYIPAMKDGKPIDVSRFVTINWSLSGP